MPDNGSLCAGTFRDLLVAAANHPSASWRMEGSYDWSKKPGRLTVYIDLDEQAWDEVYDEINSDEDVISRG